MGTHLYCSNDKNPVWFESRLSAHDAFKYL